MERIYNYINGQLLEATDRTTLDVYDPSKGSVYCLAPDSSSEDIDIAIDAAKSAFPVWRNTAVNDRNKILYKIAELIDENAEQLALAESIDNGKPLSLAKAVDIPRASANIRFFAEAMSQFSSESHAMGRTAINYTLRNPLGVVGCISPWNLPLYLFTWKIAPALASGNTVVAKPSEITPMTAYLFSKICVEAGLPAGVLNVVHGYGHKAGASLVGHSDIKAVSFTGSTKTGEIIAKEVAPKFKKLSLELGGKNPNIIFDDCDYDKMLNTTIRSSFANQGQICLCGSRIFVQRPIYEKFKNDFVKRTNELIVGPPQEKDSNLGALVSKEHFDKILYYINLAKEEGGVVLSGGNSVQLNEEHANGWYIRPTILENLSYDCRTNQEEIFGPVVSITPFDTEDEVLHMANSTEYGLSATVWTQNLKRANKMSTELDAGIVWINTWLLRDLRTPFGGMKNSGVGREGGLEALRFFTETKNVCIKL